MTHPTTVSTQPTAGLDPEIRASLAASLRELFATTTRGSEITNALDDLGWAEVEDVDFATATTLLFRAQGAALGQSNLLSDAMIRSFGPGLPTTSTSTSLLLPHPSDDGARPGSQHPLRLRGILLDNPPADAHVLIPACQGDRVVVTRVNAAWVLERSTAATGFDNASTWRLLDTTDALPASGPESIAAVDWVAALALGRRALAAEILGVCESALGLAADHVVQRHQYGRPIGSFQSVRHRLAEAHVALESGLSLLDSAWRVATDESSLDTPPEWAAAVAKARAGRAQAEVMRTCVQVLGAMGLTMESPLHRHVSRAAALDLLLGGHTRLEESLGDSLLDGTTAYPIATI